MRVFAAGLALALSASAVCGQGGGQGAGQGAGQGGGQGGAGDDAAAAAPLARALVDARRFASVDGERLWPGYGEVSMEALIVTPGRETLLCRGSMPQGFAPDGTDPATGCARFARPRGALPAGLLAAMPVFGPPATIVMGTPEATGRSPADWTRTLLHEHFHQWQSALPGYYARVAALGLGSEGDGGMWMLDYAFPYADPAIGAAYRRAAAALADGIEARGTPGFRRAVARYLDARARFARASGMRNWRYLDFELWQEGVARWTEITLGRTYPDPAVRATADALAARTLAALRAPDLPKQGRELAYPYGAGEAMLLEACAPGWRKGYVAVLGLTPLWKACGLR